MFHKVYLHLAPWLIKDIYIITIVKKSNRALVFKICSVVLSELQWIAPKCKQIFSVSPLISFMDFGVFQEHGGSAKKVLRNISAHD